MMQQLYYHIQELYIIGEGQHISQKGLAFQSFLFSKWQQLQEWDSLLIKKNLTMNQNCGQT